MGNCLTPQGSIVQVMKMDGKIIEYRACIEVNQVISDFEGHAVSDMFPVEQYLQPDAKLVGGRLYYLIPIQKKLPTGTKKKVTFLEPEMADEIEPKSIRIKVVISKQELKEMLANGVVSIAGIVANQLKEDSETYEPSHQSYSSQAWKPALRSIPEIDDLPIYCTV